MTDYISSTSNGNFIAKNKNFVFSSLSSNETSDDANLKKSLVNALSRLGQNVLSFGK